MKILKIQVLPNRLPKNEAEIKMHYHLIHHVLKQNQSEPIQNLKILTLKA